MSDWDDADPVTASALLAVGQFGEPVERQVAALSSAIEILRASADLEGRLERTGEYCITGSTMTKVRGKN